MDFVTIATPNDFHRPIAVQALSAGKHVISEKPVTMTSDDLQAMIDAGASRIGASSMVKAAKDL